MAQTGVVHECVVGPGIGVELMCHAEPGQLGIQPVAVGQGGVFVDFSEVEQDGALESGCQLEGCLFP